MVSVSVIVPIYNVENQIEKCARTLFEQTLNSIEYIFVDDATPDNSIEILNRVIKDYPNREDSIKILHHERNKGLPAARQTGLKEATGEYIIHCDSDDWVDRDMYRQLYLYAKKNDLDMAICDYFNVAENGDITVHPCSSCASPNLIQDAFLKIMPVCVWTKLVKRERALDSRIALPVGTMGEDLSTTLQTSLYCNKIGHLATPLYYYRRISTSITKQKDLESTIRKQHELESNFKQVVRAITREGRLDEYAEGIDHFSLYVKNQLLPALSKGYPTHYWRDSCKEINKKVLNSHLFSMKEKALFLVTFLGLYRIIKQG